MHKDFNIKLHWKLFYAGLSQLLAGYASMAAFTADFIRLTAAPIIILTGFTLVAIAILKKQ